MAVNMLLRDIILMQRAHTHTIKKQSYQYINNNDVYKLCEIIYTIFFICENCEYLILISMNIF